MKGAAIFAFVAAFVGSVSGFVNPSVTRMVTKTQNRVDTSLNMAGGGKKEEWVTVLKSDEIAPGDLVPVETDGLSLLVAADLDGSIYCVANICPHLGTPLDQGSIGADGTLVCPLHKSAFSLETGEVVGEWCPFPPLLGPLVLGKLEPAKNLSVFQCRSKGKDIEVLIDRNLKENFESGYWAGLLDAKGKATGDYY